MSALADYAEGKILDHIFKIAAYTVPTNIYVGLATAATNDNGTTTEVVGGSYARQICNTWTRSGNVASNGASINFPNMPACTVTHLFISESLTLNTSWLFHGAATAPVVVTAGQTLSIAIGELDITLN